MVTKFRGTMWSLFFPDLKTLHLSFNFFCILSDVIRRNYPSQNSQRPRARIPKP
jgi:hypothetical protein